MRSSFFAPSSRANHTRKTPGQPIQLSGIGAAIGNLQIAIFDGIIGGLEEWLSIDVSGARRSSGWNFPIIETDARRHTARISDINLDGTPIDSHFRVMRIGG